MLQKLECHLSKLKQQESRHLWGSLKQAITIIFNTAKDWQKGRDKNQLD